MKHLHNILIPVLLMIAFPVKSQEVISSGGTYVKANGIALSWTLGEMVTETLSNGTFKLTQGFQQSKLGTTAVDNILIPGLSLTVYPNPISAILNIRIDKGDYSQLQYSLLTIDGKILLNNKITKDLTPIDMQAYRAGNYLLKISKKNGDPVKTVKIVKESGFN